MRPAVFQARLKPTSAVSDSSTLYPYYTALDLATIPFHTGSGGWGAQRAVVAPTAPTTTSTSNATSLAALQTAVAVAGRWVTCTAGFTGGSLNTVAAGVRISVAPGVLIDGELIVNQATTNLQIDGTALTAGAGGQIRFLGIGGGVSDDVIIGGLSITGDDTDDAHALQVFNGVRKCAIVNNRINAGASGYIGTGSDIVFAGNSINTGAGPGAGSLEAWGIRESGDGPIIVFQNDIRCARTPGNPAYHRVRTAPNADTQLIWVADNTFVDLSESRIYWVNTYSGHQPPLARAAGSWFLNNRVYGTGSGLSIDTGSGGPGSTGSGDNNASAVYSRVNGNTIYGTGFSAASIDIEGTGATDTDKTGNTFNATAAAPAWGAAGDPTGLDWEP